MLKYTQFMPSEKMDMSTYNRTRCLPVSGHVSQFFQYGSRNWKNCFKWSETVTSSKFPCAFEIMKCIVFPLHKK